MLGQLGFKACVQSARNCLVSMLGIARSAEPTYRGVTGYLASNFAHDRMGMDYAFFSTSMAESMAADFAGSAASSVLFVVEFSRGCPGTDISMLSLFPSEKAVLFAPLTAFSLMAASSSGVGGKAAGAGVGQARISVYPTAAH